MKVKSIKPITPKSSKCIEVDSAEKLFAIGSNILTHNSVCQQNIIFGCLMRPEHWVILGIDLKRVELSRFREFGMKVATDLETAIEFLRFAQAVMMSRYTLMESLGINNFKDLPEKTQALMVMIDELGELLSPSGAKALSEFTPVCTPTGLKPLKDINIGDIILDAHSLPAMVTAKYEPESQERYELTISTDTDSESFIAGSEHLWVIRQPRGSAWRVSIVDTKTLFNIHSTKKPVKFVKWQEECESSNGSYKTAKKWFTLKDIQLTENTDRLYCISVDSTDKQFLIGKLGIPTHNSDEAKAADELKGEAVMILGSLARLGRASGVHLVLATQRPDAKILPGEIRDNFGARIGCGTLQPSASTMILGSNIGQRIRSNPRGGLYVQIYGKGNMGQGFYAGDGWLADYNKRTGVKAVKANIGDIPDDTAKPREKSALEDWDETMDELIE